MTGSGAVTELVCLQCGHHWVPRVSHPKVCPYCKGYNWDKSTWEVENGTSIEDNESK